MINKTEVFESRTQGYHTYRIPSMLATDKGVVLAGCEARPGQGGDHDFNDIVMRRSTDGGRTFGPLARIVDHATYGDGPASNLVMIHDPCDDRIHAVFCHDYARLFYMVSEDQGASFSDPVDMTEVLGPCCRQRRWCVFATGPGHGLRMRSGRMIVPVWGSDGSSNPNSEHRAHRPSDVLCIYSDDAGATWHAGEMVCHDQDMAADQVVRNPSETVAVELADGSVMLNLRSESDVHRRLVAVSPDGIRNWQLRGFDQALLDPICMASMIRLTWPDAEHAGELVFVNPHVLEKDMGHKNFDRKRLTAKLSRDDGQTWPVSKIIDSGVAGYSDLACLPDGTILCLYEADMINSMYDNRYLRLARFDRDWLTEPD